MVFCFLAIKVTGSSDHAFSTIHWYLNLRKITSIQFPEPVDFFDAPQSDPDGVALKTGKVITSI